MFTGKQIKVVSLAKDDIGLPIATIAMQPSCILRQFMIVLHLDAPPAILVVG